MLANINVGRGEPSFAQAEDTIMPIDLNCDMGELAGDVDAALMPFITSANIACGLHAGDSSIMAHTIALAQQHGVAIGAHPGYDDRANFGRREMQLAPDALENLLRYQLGAIRGMCEAQGVELTHIKPHGALYNQAARDPALATLIARSVRRFDPRLVLFGLAGSPGLAAMQAAGMRVAAEAFADRAYEADGSLRRRDLPGAVLTSPAAAATQALHIVQAGCIIAYDGSSIPVQADTLCVHGDNLAAAQVLAAVHSALAAAGVAMQAIGRRRPSPSTPLPNQVEGSSTSDAEDAP